MSILKDWGINTIAKVLSDASAALGIIGRSGLGKLRHIDTSYLWLQQDSIKKKLELDKVKGTENPADMNTKGLKAEDIIRYTEMLNMEHRQGRSDLAPEVNQIINKQTCVRSNSSPARVTKKFTQRI